MFFIFFISEKNQYIKQKFSKVSAYEINSDNGSSNKIGEYKNSAPPLDIVWGSNGSNIISAGCDKIIKIWNPQQQSPMIIGYHSKPIRKIAFASDNNNNNNNSSPSSMVISGGWDKDLKYWDPKQSTPYILNKESYCSELSPIFSLSLNERIYAMDLKFPLLCVALANKKVVIFDVRNPNKAIKEMNTLLKHQLRCIACFPDQKGFAVGSVEGRCAIHYINEDLDRNMKNFAFKCHRKKQNVYGVNTLKFHDKLGTFGSGGGDGTIYFWDKDEKQKLKEFKQMNLPITDIDFNYNGQLFAYSISYDWSKGIEYFQPKSQKPNIFIHKLQLNEIQPKNNNNNNNNNNN